MKADRDGAWHHVNGRVKSSRATKRAAKQAAQRMCRHLSTAKTTRKIRGEQTEATPDCKPVRKTERDRALLALALGRFGCRATDAGRVAQGALGGAACDFGFASGL